MSTKSGAEWSVKKGSVLNARLDAFRTGKRETRGPEGV
jgi:hypothetical protein